MPFILNSEIKKIEVIAGDAEEFIPAIYISMKGES